MVPGVSEREDVPRLPPGVGDSLLSLLNGFVAELRAAGIPVSLTEQLDTMRAVEHVEWADREMLKQALAATLVKDHDHWQAFETAFEVYFSLRGPGYLIADGRPHRRTASDEHECVAARDGGSGRADGGQVAAGEGGPTSERLAGMLYEALLEGDPESLRLAAGQAVRHHAGMEPGRPVGGAYYLYRTLRNLELGNVLELLLAAGQQTDGAVPEADDFAQRLRRDVYDQRVSELESHIRSEIRRRLVADRGAQAVAKTLRKPLPDAVSLVHASPTEMDGLRRAVRPFARKLAARMARRRRSRSTGYLDFRATMRSSLSYGGVPVELEFRKPRPHKPDIMVIADISGSVAAFSHFTLQFVYVLASQFSKVRSFAFIDGLDEVTELVEGADDISEAVSRVNAEADVVWMDGNSDYGHAFSVFWDVYGDDVGPRTSVLVLGDARNNYHDANSWIVHAMRRRARRLYWLNPEPRSYWNTGDSIIGDYAPACDGVFEARNLRQLEAFVDRLD